MSFRQADLRGADFTRARLARADFTGATLGIPPAAGLVVVLAALAVAAAAGVVVGLVAGDVREIAFSPGWVNRARGVGFLLLALLFVGALWAKGLRPALLVLVVSAGVLALVGLVVVSVQGEYEPMVTLRLAGLTAVITAVFLGGVIARILGGTTSTAGLTVVAVTGGLVAGRTGGGIGALLLALAMAVMAKRALRGDGRARPVHRLARRIVAPLGTRFDGADVREATFSGGSSSTPSPLTGEAIASHGRNPDRGTTRDGGPAP